MAETTARQIARRLITDWAHTVRRGDLAAAVSEFNLSADGFRAMRDRVTNEISEATVTVTFPGDPERDAWTVPKIPHDETRSVTPIVRGPWIRREAGDSTAAHTRTYAAQLLAAADTSDADTEATKIRPIPVQVTRWHCSRPGCAANYTSETIAARHIEICPGAVATTNA